MKRESMNGLLAALSGILAGLSIILPEHFGAIEWIALTPFFIALMQYTKRITAKLSHFFTLGFLFYFTYGLTYFHWFIALYPLDFTGLNNFESIVVIFLAWVALSALYALLGGVFFLLYGALSRLSLLRRFPSLCALVLPILFVLYEFAHTLDWWGVPWGKLALGQTYWMPMLQTASLFGSYFICALIVFVNAAIALLFVKGIKKSSRLIPAALALVLLSANILGGMYLYQTAPSKADGKELTKIAVLQGNNPSQSDMSDFESFSIYLDLSAEAALEGATVILWPESSIAGAISETNIFGLYASKLAREYEVYLITGTTSYRADEENPIHSNEYNSMTFIRPDGTFGEQTYDKRHLVPFGEFVPYRAFFETFIPPLVEVTMLDQDNTPGTEAVIFEGEGTGRLGGLICFESIYERLALDTVRAGAEIFIVGTNDSWFRTSLATSMHRAHEQLRSIECGRYSTRAATTGITCIIDARGEVLDSLPLHKRGYLIAEVPQLDHTTLYVKTGDLIVPTLAFTLLALFGTAIVLYRKGIPREINPASTFMSNNQKSKDGE